ncbi:hypothetical protein [Aquabacterium sp.]|uniref:hypothetical protein n=1 Tax=Aquabacterium sp. TaxID=1872578 RepID=UPI0024886257|nr:hypothetical protein [Aquabacterium sp.]MDI1347909.1 hypothetical protein [Aquabacterium sp.]
MPVRKSRNRKVRAIVCDPLDLVFGARKRAADDRGTVTKVRLTNHVALDAFRTGSANWELLNTLIEALNTAVCLCALGVLAQHTQDVTAGLAALLSMTDRNQHTCSLTFTGPEWSAVCEAMAVHDDQLDVCLVGQRRPLV